MIVDVIGTGGEWVLPRLSKKFAEVINKGNGKGKHIVFYSLYNMVPPRKADNNLRVALFTHDNQDGEFLKFANRCDYIICMAPQYERYFREQGFKNVKTITIPPDPQFKCRLVLAWIGHFQNKDRKGFKLYQKIKEISWVRLIHPDHIPFNNIPDAYEICDYVVCTSNLEGGPLSLVEGLACGKQMIIPIGVGNAELFKAGIISYEKSNWCSLYQVLRQLYIKKFSIANLVLGLTWENFGIEINKVFEEMNNW